jgi:Fe-S-cluster containining protein
MFRPGEAEVVAKHLGVTFEDLFQSKLAVDVVHDIDRDTYTLLPATVETRNAGGVYRNGEGGQCVFFKAGRCQINAVKPWECRVTDHASEFTRRQEAAWARPWRRRQRRLESLLGHKLPPRAVVGLKDWNDARYRPDEDALRDLRERVNVG